MKEEIKPENLRIHSRADELIACLEGEIAKRDETIARLEPQLNRAIQANYDLREELAACRVAVENCEVFRARIVELESQYQRDVYGLNNEGDPIGGDPAGGYANDNARLRAELSALKAQEPVEYQLRALIRDVTNIPEAGYYMPQSWHDQVIALSLSGKLDAPVSEAKAQEPDCDRSACGDFSPGPCDNPDCSARRDRTVVAPAAKAQGVALDGSQLAGLLEQVRLDDDEAKPHGSGAVYWNNAVIACQVAIRDALADHVQQVIVPDVSAMARILADRNADACNVNREDNWAIHGQDYIDDVTAMLAAAPAAPVADAPPENCRQRLAAEGKPYPRSSCAACGQFSPKWRECDAALAANRAKGVV